MQSVLKIDFLKISRFLLCVIICGSTTGITLFFVSWYYLAFLKMATFYKLCIGFAIVHSNTCMFTIEGQYMCFILYTSTRFVCINNILQQLIIEEPLKKHLIFVIDNDKLIYKTTSEWERDNKKFPKQKIFLEDRSTLKKLSYNGKELNDNNSGLVGTTMKWGLFARIYNLLYMTYVSSFSY